MQIKFLVSSFLAISYLAGQQIVIRTGTILDGKGRVLRNEDITVNAGRISRIGPRSGTASYDLSRYTVMPGWIDTHIHLSGHFVENPRDRRDGNTRNPDSA